MRPSTTINGVIRARQTDKGANCGNTMSLSIGRREDNKIEV